MFTIKRKTSCASINVVTRASTSSSDAPDDYERQVFPHVGMRTKVERQLKMLGANFLAYD